MPLDIQLFRTPEGLAKVRASQAARYADPAQVDAVVDVDARWRTAEFERNRANKAINECNQLIKVKKQAKEECVELLEQMKQLKQEQKACEDRCKELKAELVRLVNRIGNLVHESVPHSKSEKDNQIVKSFNRQGGDGPCLERTVYHHHELLHMIDGYSAERGVKVAGHRGYFLKGVGVMLNQALIQYGLAFLAKKQFTALQTPFFMRKDVMAKTAQLEEFDEALYHVSGGGCDDESEKDLYLIATSEQPISAYHMNETLVPEQLPLKYAGSSTCFRKEAGAHGKDAWGIFRIHQFEKIEQFCITSPEDSWKVYDEMLANCEEFYQSLGLSYQVVRIVSGALNNAAAKKLDIEAYFPTMGVYRELVSASNCLDYQSRALDIKYGFKKGPDQAAPFVHMLNATLCATERTMCCLLENYQTAEGVVVPPVLRPFMGGVELLPFVHPPPKASEAAAKSRAQAK